MSEGPEIVTLQDESTGDSVSLMVSQGFNCFRWERGEGSARIDALWARPGHESGTERASSGGIPILFPFPGRLPGTTFDWLGKTYELEPFDALGNAIHGFVFTRRWRSVVVETNRCTAEFQASIDDPGLLPRWPSDFRIVATYRLRGDTLRFECEVTNLGPNPMPFGLGLHPYFRVGIFGGAAAEDRVTAEVGHRWLLEQMRPTGKREPEPFGLASGAPFGGLTLDDVFDHEPAFENLDSPPETLRVAKIEGPNGRMEIRYDVDYPFAVLYTPPHREAICIEPYTCLPGSIPKGEQGTATGLRILPPGDRWTTAVEYRWVST
jgi:aldose 1-epimerase